MNQETERILRDAVGRNIGVVLSLPAAGMLRHHKSRFLAQDSQGLWIESAPQDNAVIDDLIAGSQSAAVSFKLGTGKASFKTTPLKRDSTYRINGLIQVEGLLVSQPDQIQVVQRRIDYRARLLRDTEVGVKLWRIAEHIDLSNRPRDQLQLSIELRDLSIGGLGILLLPQKDRPHNLVADERLRVELQHAGEVLLLEGRVRHVPATMPPGPVPIGVQFSHAGDLGGRQKLAVLTRILAQLQRDEVRRTRLGLVSP